MIQINIENLIQLNITIKEFMLLCIIKEQKYELAEKYVEINGSFIEDDFTRLLNENIIQFIDSNVSSDEKYFINNLTFGKKCRIFVNNEDVQVINSQSAKDWIREWWNLFPSGIKSGGYYVKTDVNGCLKKMNKFLYDNPDYDNKDLVIEATKNYVARHAMKGYSMMKLAPYFIEKDRVSTLAGECQAILDKANTVDYDKENSL